MNKVTIATTATVALLVAGLSINVIAASNKDKAAIEEAEKNAAISMNQAVKIAELATGGKKTSAELDIEDGMPKYEVDLNLSDGTEVEVDIDATSGVIMSQTGGADARATMSTERMGTDNMMPEQENGMQEREPEIIEEMMNEHKGDMLKQPAQMKPEGSL